MNIQKILISKLNPAKYNPRKDLKPGDAEYEKLKRSILEFGFVEPVIWNKATGNIVGGHQRYKVLKGLGYNDIECVVLDIDDQKEKALNIALNKVSGDWDKPLLADLLKELDTVGFDVSLTGFDIAELNELFGEPDTKDDDFDTDTALEEIKIPITKTGDIWQLGKHRLICGDSTMPETYEKLMEGQKANLVATDPPFGVSYSGGQGTIKNDNLKDDDFLLFLQKAFTNMHSHMSKDASIYVFHADTKGLIFRQAFQDAGFYLSGVCIWEKQSLVLGRSPYQWQHEPCLFGWRKDGKHQWYGDRKQTTIWKYDRPAKSPLHSTMKPIALMAYPIMNSTMTNGIVLEPFSGSASTLIACEQTDRICYAIELEERFVDVGVKRYIEFKGGSDDVFLLRDGKKIKYSDIEKDAE